MSHPTRRLQNRRPSTPHTTTRSRPREILDIKKMVNLYDAANVWSSDRRAAPDVLVSALDSSVRASQQQALWGIGAASGGVRWRFFASLLMQLEEVLHSVALGDNVEFLLNRLGLIYVESLGAYIRWCP